MSNNLEGEFGTKVAAHIRALEGNIASLDSLDVGVLFEETIGSKNPFAFEEIMRYLAGKYKEATGADPSLELIVTIDMLGDSDVAKRMALRGLKAMREDDFWGKIIKKIVVKGENREKTVGLEPNVFNSDVHFEKL